MSPVLIEEPPRAELKIGFVPKKDISYREELFFDYRLRSQPDFEWHILNGLALMRQKIATTFQKLYSTRANIADSSTVYQNNAGPKATEF